MGAEAGNGKPSSLHASGQARADDCSASQERLAGGHGQGNRAAERPFDLEVKNTDSYIAYLRKDSGSDYGVEFPDLPGCFSAGSTMEEAKAMAAEALAGHVSVQQAEGLPVPAPSTMDQLASDPNRGDAVLFLVDLDPSLLKAERVNVMIPRHLLGRIDAVAGSGNRSRFLVEAAEQRLAG